MCQVGYMAAAGIYALDNNIERLRDDHKRAKLLGEALNKNNYVKKVEPIETNIIIFNVVDTVDENVFIQKLKESNILISSMGNGKLRMVTHLDFNDDMLDIVLKKLKSLNF